MKAIVFLWVLAALGACQDGDSVQSGFGEDQPWTIVWEIENHVSKGTIFLNPDNEARVIITEPDDLLFHQPEDITFHWRVTEENFSLTRADNGFTITYKIDDQLPDYYQLSLDHDLIVKIYR